MSKSQFFNKSIDRDVPKNLAVSDKTETTPFKRNLEMFFDVDHSNFMKSVMASVNPKEQQFVFE